MLTFKPIKRKRDCIPSTKTTKQRNECFACFTAANQTKAKQQWNHCNLQFLTTAATEISVFAQHLQNSFYQSNKCIILSIIVFTKPIR